MPKIVIEVPDNCMECKFRNRHKKVFRYCLMFNKHLEDMKGSGKTVQGLARCKECKDAEIRERKAGDEEK